MQQSFSGEPYWWLEAPLSDGNPGTPAPSCDVAIVGAGYTGLAATLELARAGRSVQVFDSRRPGEGASTRNGGIASGNLRTSLSGAVASMGSDAALALFAEAFAARDDLAAFIKAEAIDCDYQKTGRFTGAISLSKLEEMKRDADLLGRHFGVKTRFVAKEQLHDEAGTQAYCGGIVREDLALVHPGKLHAGMLKAAEAAGAMVFGNMAVRGIEKRAGGYNLDTAKGKIAARHVIVATNGYTDAALPWLRRRLLPVKSRIVVTGELPSDLMHKLMPNRRAMGETRRLYRYYRPTPDGRRILLGARETVFSHDPRTNAAHVHRRLLDIFPELEPYGIGHSWNGHVAFSRDLQPGLFEKDGVLHACGYCGSGVVWARWLGKKAALKLLGKAEAATFFEGPPPKAIPFYEGRPWFFPAVLAWNGLMDRWEMRKAP